MSNIFLLSPDIPAEDRFTAHLHYVVDNIPAVGQSIVDLLLTRAGLPTSRFTHAVDHPPGTPTEHPDFLIATADLDILTEHKIGSALEPRQLERYLGLERARDTRVALITTAPYDVSDEVASDERYLKPTEGPLRHFLWEDLYPIVADRPERLAREFAEYMRVLGMRPWQPASWADLFSNEETARGFGEQLVLVREHFAQMGAVCRRNSGHLGLQVQYPAPWLPLLYVVATRRLEQLEPRVPDPYLAVQVLVRRDDPARAAMSAVSEVLDAGGVRVAVRGRESAVAWNSGLVGALEYVASLDDVLSTDTARTRQALLAVTTAAFAHANGLHDRASAHGPLGVEADAERASA